MFLDIDYFCEYESPCLDYMSYPKTKCVKVDETLEDIIEYLFNKKYHRAYNWVQDKESREFCKKIEDDWFYNRIDTFELFQDIEFKSYLKEKYIDEIGNKLFKELYFEVNQMQMNLQDEESAYICVTIDDEYYFDGYTK